MCRQDFSRAGVKKYNVKLEGSESNVLIIFVGVAWPIQFVDKNCPIPFIFKINFNHFHSPLLSIVKLIKLLFSVVKD